MSDTLEAIKAATTTEEMAEALSAWAEELSVQVGESPLWWITELWRYVNGQHHDETGGATIDELIPEAVAEWQAEKQAIIAGSSQP